MTDRVKFMYITDPNESGRVITLAYRRTTPDANGRMEIEMGWASSRPGNRLPIVGRKGRIVGYSEQREPGDSHRKADGRKNALERLQTAPACLTQQPTEDLTRTLLHGLVKVPTLPVAVRQTADDFLDRDYGVVDAPIYS